MDARATLIALNAHPRLNRGALCRLAADLDAWSDLRGRDRPGQREAAELGVPTDQLRRAVAALGDAPAVARAERRRARQLGTRLLTRLDAEYPEELLDHPLPPPVLYLRGTLRRRPAIAIVGAREMSAYGQEAAELFAGELARAGVTVISGFARGVDQAAHRATVRAGGATVAVLGCGIDISYPARSDALAREISRTGALISEFPFGREPRAWHFPIRNRVIATLTAGTLVVQAKEKSGSLITAHLALELGREVFAVPGSIFDDLARGTNGLIADGAIPALSPLDILDHLAIGAQTSFLPEPEPAAAGRRNGEPRKSHPHPSDSLPLPAGLAGRILASITPGADGNTADELAERCGEGVDRVLSALLELELAGWIERAPGPLYLR
ncbi:MAG: DNA-processing protein DprA [Holophagales bacterium]|nr:DNA-processing protein DprA [Holophagales bacterium]